VNNWGGMDYQDVMAGVDAVLKQNPWIDSDRLGVTGGSYGGFLTNWILGHTTRFKAAVTLRSISNFVSDDGTRDGAYGHEDDFKGIVFDDLDQYWDASPLKFAEERQNADLDSAFGQRFPCADRAGRAMVSRAEAFMASMRSWCSFRARITT